MTTPHNAQSSLDDIRRLQDQTRTEYVRHSLARPYMLVSALALFIAFASFDLPSPWDATVGLLGVGLAAGSPIVQQCRASVRRKPTGPERLFYAAWLAGFAMFYVTFSIATALANQAFGLPAPHTIAAAALAVTTVVAAAWNRPILMAILRRESRHG